MFEPKKIWSRVVFPWVLALVSAWLAWEPAGWLWRTWTDVSWGSDGEWVFFAVVGVFAWSLSSRSAGESHRGLWTWLGFSAVVRAIGNVLAVNVISALMLCLDVYALGRMGRLESRERAVEPLYLALAFGFCLPVERILQRLFGHALQWVSARGAYGLLSVAEPGTRLDGMELSVQGTRVLVDLPCSGARSLTVLLVTFLLVAAVRRPGLKGFVWGGVATVMAALVSNTLRIFLLAEGIVREQALGIDVMAEPWHSLVGLCCLALVLPGIFWTPLGSPTSVSAGASTSVSAGAPTSVPVGAPTSVLVGAPTSVLVGSPTSVSAGAPTSVSAGAPTSVSAGAPTSVSAVRSLLGMLMLGLGVWSMTFVEPEPMDVSRPVEAIELPPVAFGAVAEPQELSAMERDYFTSFGGAAARARYGAYVLLLVRTSSPVRHLHSPEECMAGAGWQVERIGVTGTVAPGATWRIERAGQVLRVRATYVSSDGVRVATLEEAIWRWLMRPATTWTAVERVYPVWASPEMQDAFDREIFHRLSFEEGP